MNVLSLKKSLLDTHEAAAATAAVSNDAIRVMRATVEGEFQLQ